MKNLFYILLLISSAAAQAALEYCLADAKTFASHQRPVAPEAECAAMIKSHPEKVEARSSDGSKYIYGLGHMFYVETWGKLPSGESSLLKRELMAGDQTELSRIRDIRINESAKRISVLQHEGNQSAILMFDLNFIGNVSPLRKFQAARLKNVSGFKLLHPHNEVFVMSETNPEVWSYNYDADVRLMADKFKPRILRELKGPSTELKKPIDVVISPTEKKIYILDSGRVLVFSFTARGNASPDVIKNAAGATSLDLDDKGQLILIH